MKHIAIGLVLSVLLGVQHSSTSGGALTAPDIVARSVKAHGGAKLSSWRTMTIAGTIEMEDGVRYRAAYRVSAKLPDKLKVEQDMTVDRGGRYTYEYFRNGKDVWSRRNLIPGKADPARLDRWMNQLFGVEYFARHATALALKGEATSDWMEKSAEGRYQVSEKRPAYVVSATLPEGTATLFFDTRTFFLLEEQTAAGRRLYSGFRPFSGTTHPARILEIAKGRGGDVVTPITYDAVKYNVQIPDWLFEEDRPAAGGR